MRTLHLTSPHMTGPDVRLAQHRLGVFVDGDYGPMTGEAARVWKYRAGFPKRDVNTGLGLFAQKLLERGPKEKLPPAYAARRIARLAHSKIVPSWGRKPVPDLGARALADAHEYVGLMEDPAGSNHVGRLEALARSLGVSPGIAGMGFSWCAFFVFLMLLREGSKVARDGLVLAKFNALFVPTIHALAQTGQFGLSLVGAHDARPGDLVVFNWDGGPDDHVGFLAGPINFAAGTLPTVEGNTSFGPGGSQSNGGCVAARTDRTLSEVTAFVRVAN